MENRPKQDPKREKTEFEKNIIRDTETAKRRGRNGGLARSKRKRVANTLKGRKKCSTTCAMYPCWAFPLTMKGAEFEGQCALKKFSPQMQNTTVDLYLKGEKGFNRQMVEILCRTGIKVATTEEEYKQLDHIISVKKSIFGDKNKVQADVKHEHKLGTADIVRIIKRSRNESIS